jgi:hypothetical protein
MFMNTNYLLWVFIPSLILSGLAQWYVRSSYTRWGQVRNSLGLTGAQVAQAIMQRTNVKNIEIQGARGMLTDHYDPTSHTVRLSEGNFTQPSVAAMAITAHELGHAQQHQEGSPLIAARTLLVPAVQFTPTVGYLMIMLGLMTGAMGLFNIGILLFGVMVVFMILTLPVEIDASLRGMKLLREAGLFQAEHDASGSRQMLTAAALTYIAAAVTAVLQLLYFISLSRNRQ